MNQEIIIKLNENENVPRLTKEQIMYFTEIVNALISSGGLTGVKGGKTIIHFDGDGVFQGIELDYWPWRKRRK